MPIGEISEMFPSNSWVAHHFNYPVAAIERSHGEFSTKSIEELKRIPKHLNLMHFYHTERTDSFIFLAYEMYDCTLNEYVGNYHNVQTIISEKEVCIQLIDGLCHLQKHGYKHDLKKENVLLKILDTNSVLIKLLDVAIMKGDMVWNIENKSVTGD